MADQKPSPDELQELLKQDKSDRLQSCKGEIEATLQTYKCQLVALPLINPDGKVIAEVQIAILP